MRFGQYEILERLAYGGMAEVLLARWERLNAQRLVVVKKILPHLSADPEFVRMFLDEVRITARLDHPNIVHIYDAGEVEGTPFLVMEYVRGVTLKECLEAEGALSQAEGVGIGIELAKALSYAHSQKDPVIHRDVTPQNILLGVEGYVKLADFGIAKVEDRITHTQAGLLKGKLSYMAPELLEGGSPSPLSDLYALGLVLFETLTGKRAYPRASEAELFTIVRAGAWQRDLPEYRRLDPDLKKILERTLSRHPRDRFPDVRGVLRELQLYYSRKILDPWEELLMLRVERVMSKLGKLPEPAGSPAQEIEPERKGKESPLEKGGAPEEETLEPTRAMEVMREGRKGVEPLPPSSPSRAVRSPSAPSRRSRFSIKVAIHRFPSYPPRRMIVAGAIVAVSFLVLFMIPFLRGGSRPILSHGVPNPSPPQGGSSSKGPPSLSSSAPTALRIPSSPSEAMNPLSLEVAPPSPLEGNRPPEKSASKSKSTSSIASVPHPSPSKTSPPTPSRSRRISPEPLHPISPSPPPPEPPPQGPGFLSIQVIPWAFVAIGGEVQRTPVVRKSLPPGKYEVRLRNPGLNWEMVTTVTIRAGEETRLIYNTEGGSP
jgi:serine/threonine-protein kinase